METQRALSFRYSNKSFHQPLDPFASSVHLIHCAKVIKFNYHQPSQAVLPAKYSQSIELVRSSAPPPVQMGNVSIASERGSRKIKLITTKKFKGNQRLSASFQQNPEAIISKSSNFKDKSNIQPVIEASFQQKQMKDHRYTYQLPHHIAMQGPSCSIFKSCQDPYTQSNQQKIKKKKDGNQQPQNYLSTKQDTPKRHKIFQHLNQNQNYTLPINNLIFSQSSPFNHQIIRVDKQQQINEPVLQIAALAISRNFTKNKIVDCIEQTINDSDIPSMILQNWDSLSQKKSLRQSFS